MPKLGVISYLVLGMIRLRGPSTSYELKRAVGKSLGYFWPFPHSQLYREPVRLAAIGLLEEEQEHGGRNRRIYTITNAGQEALRVWLEEPVHKIQELRDLAQLKVFFSELMTTDKLVALAREQIALHQAYLATYEKMDERYHGVPELSHRVAPLTMGLLLEQASIAYWTTIAENPPAYRQANEEEKGEAVEAGRDH
jgi:PadR family transcriptional regulator, regulatory protein AphA